MPEIIVEEGTGARGLLHGSASSFLEQGYPERSVWLVKTGAAVVKGKLLRSCSGFQQIISNDYPHHPWEKDNFSGPEHCRNLVKDVLDESKGK